MARHNEQAKLLMSTTGVGAIISLTYAAAIDDPARFESSKVVGAHYGMTPKKYQSGQTDYNVASRRSAMRACAGRSGRPLM